MAKSDGTLGRWRWVLILGGVALAIAGFWLWVDPVDHTRLAPDSAKCASPAECVVKVDDAPELLLSTLVVLGTFVTLIGINNRKITKFSGPGGFAFEAEVKETASIAFLRAADKVEEKATEANMSPLATEFAKLLAGHRARVLVYEHIVAGARASPTLDLEQVAERASESSVRDVSANPSIK